MIGLLGTLWTVSSTYLIAIKWEHALLFKSLGYIIWLGHGIKKRDKWVIITNIFLILIGLWGWVEWRK